MEHGWIHTMRALAAAREPKLAERQSSEALWNMTPEQRVAAMWRGELSIRQLCEWSRRAPAEVPLINGEFAYIVMRTPEWLERHDMPQRAMEDQVR